MSTIEIIIYVTLGVFTLIYVIHVIRKAIKLKKIKKNSKDAPLTIKDEDEEE